MNAGIEVHFVHDQVTFSRNGVVEMVGRRAGNELYHLDMMAKNCEQQSHDALLTRQAASISAWHQRFAHVNYQTLMKMSSQGAVTGLNLIDVDINSLPLCEGCILGKMHRLPFTTGRTRATEVGHPTLISETALIIQNVDNLFNYHRIQQILFFFKRSENSYILTYVGRWK